MPATYKVGEVIKIIRKKLNLERDQGLFLLANGRYIMKQNSALLEMHDRFKDEDGFLYLIYAEENVYG